MLGYLITCVWICSLLGIKGIHVTQIRPHNWLITSCIISEFEKDESKLNGSRASCASITSFNCFLMTLCFISGTTSFDDIPVTETLNHLTANRAKVPQKRPPSKVLYLYLCSQIGKRVYLYLKYDHYTSQVAHQGGAYPGFCNMKWLEVFLLPPGWDVSPSCCTNNVIASG